MADKSATQRRLGRAVRAVRIARGLTQEQVGAAADMHPTYISDIERGARNPSWEAIARLAGAMSVPTSELARRYDEDTNSNEDPPRGRRT